MVNLPDMPVLLQRPETVLAGLVISVIVLLLVAQRVRRIARSERPDETLANVAMLIGLGWSSEAVWELTGRAELPTSLRLLLFFVLETLLVLSMIRAKRSMRLHGHPGRSGRTAWIVASAMALVGAGAASSAGEALLRLIIPLLVTNAWWDGLIGEGLVRRDDATSWRWTPRRLLLWLGAIEPGERDVESVHRERVTQQMTRLEYRRRHGWDRLAGRRAQRLARLSLTADDEMIAEVRRRVDRATWFGPTQPPASEDAPSRSTPASAAASARARRVRHGKALRKVIATHPRPIIVAAQEPRQDPRATHEIDTVIRVIREALPKIPQRQIARLASVPEPTVRRALRRTQNPAPPPTNGRKPDLEGVTP